MLDFVICAHCQNENRRSETWICIKSSLSSILTAGFSLSEDHYCEFMLFQFGQSTVQRFSALNLPTLFEVKTVDHTVEEKSQ